MIPDPFSGLCFTAATPPPPPQPLLLLASVYLEGIYDTLACSPVIQ